MGRWDRTPTYFIKNYYFLFSDNGQNEIIDYCHQIIKQFKANDDTTITSNYRKTGVNGVWM